MAAIGFGAAGNVAAKPRAVAPLYVSFIDQTPPQGFGPAIRGIDERRRGPTFGQALQQVSRAGKLPPVVVLNRDLSLPSTTVGEPEAPAGARVVRIFLTQWSETPLGGISDTQILCRFSAELLRNGTVTQKLGPFFASRRFDFIAGNLPHQRLAQFQGVACQALEEMAATLNSRPEARGYWNTGRRRTR